MLGDAIEADSLMEFWPGASQLDRTPSRSPTATASKRCERCDTILGSLSVTETLDASGGGRVWEALMTMSSCELPQSRLRWGM